MSAASITPDCRTARGVEGAWDEAVRQLHDEYLEILDGWRGRPSQPTLTLVLTMDHPR